MSALSLCLGLIDGRAVEAACEASSRFAARQTVVIAHA
jgi:hypothetical protein